MDLLIDSNGLPIAYDLFPGNTHDSSTLIPFIENMRKQYIFGKVILTADKGLNSGKNLAYLISKNDGYIVSQKIRGMSNTFINEVLSEEVYACNPKGTFKIKSFLRDRGTKDENGNKVILKEKVVCFWSKDFDAREKYKRDISLDGYYTTVTSELDLSNEDIIKKYRGLWKIEEIFKVAMNYKNVRIETLRKYRKEIVHNIKKTRRRTSYALKLQWYSWFMFSKVSNSGVL
jgi:transposase